MHEVSIAGDLFEIIKENVRMYQLSQVTRIVLKIGEMTCVEENALRFAFEAFAKDTEAEGGELVIERVEATAECESCKDVFKITYDCKICPLCGQYSGKIVTGYELFIDELEGE